TLLFLLILARRRSRVQDQREDAVEIAGALIQRGDVFVQGEFAAAESYGRLRRGKQHVAQAAEGALLRIACPFAVVEGKVIARRLGIRMNIFQQPPADIEFLGRPSRFRRFFVQSQIGDGLLRGVQFSLLLVVVKDARGRPEVFGVRIERGAGFIQKLTKILGLREKVKIALHQLRVPERLKALFVHGQTLLNGALAVFHQRFGLYLEDFVARKLLLVTGDQLIRGVVLFLADQVFQKARVELRLFWVAGNPGAILRDRDFFWHALRLNNAEYAFECAP